MLGWRERRKRVSAFPTKLALRVEMNQDIMTQYSFDSQPSTPSSLPCCSSSCLSWVCGSAWLHPSQLHARPWTLPGTQRVLSKCWLDEWMKAPPSLPAWVLPSYPIPTSAQGHLPHPLGPKSWTHSCADQPWIPIPLLHRDTCWTLSQGRQSKCTLGKCALIEQQNLLFPMSNPDIQGYWSKCHSPQTAGLHRLRPVPSNAPPSNPKPNHAKPSVLSCLGNKTIPTAKHIQINTPLITHLAWSPRLWKSTGWKRT